MDVADEDVEAGAGSSSSDAESMRIGAIEDMKNKRSYFEQRMSSACNDKRRHSMSNVTWHKQCDYKSNQLFILVNNMGSKPWILLVGLLRKLNTIGYFNAKIGHLIVTKFNIKESIIYRVRCP